MNFNPADIGPMIVEFFNKLNAKIKMAVVIAVCLIFTAVCVIFSIMPLAKKVKDAWDEQKKSVTDLEQVQKLEKDRAKIEKDFKDRTDYLVYLEQQFVTTSDTPGLLESISKVAQETGLRILTLRPDTGTLIITGEYKMISIRLTGEAGTHQLGAFLRNLETGLTVFKIRDLKISGNPADERKHLFDIKLEAYRKAY